jgi:hypothetical protein
MHLGTKDRDVVDIRGTSNRSCWHRGDACLFPVWTTTSSRKMYAGRNTPVNDEDVESTSYRSTSTLHWHLCRPPSSLCSPLSPSRLCCYSHCRKGQPCPICSYPLLPLPGEAILSPRVRCHWVVVPLPFPFLLPGGAVAPLLLSFVVVAVAGRALLPVAIPVAARGSRAPPPRVCRRRSRCCKGQSCPFSSHSLSFRSQQQPSLRSLLAVQ